LITGASGFLGAEILRQAAAQTSVRVLARHAAPIPTGTAVVRGDLADPQALATAASGVRTIIHCAGLAHQFGRRQAGPEEFAKVNEIGTANVMRAAVAAGVEHVLLVSSVAVYGPGRLSPDETAPCRPHGPYAQSKLRGEQRAIDIAATGQVRLTILRLAALYGEGDPGNLARLMRAIDSGRFFWVGSGQNLKGLIHREDAARGCLLAAQRAQGQRIEIYNLAPHPCTMREVVATLAVELGRPVPRWHIPARLARVMVRAARWFPPCRRRARNWQATLDTWLRSDAFDGSRFCREFQFEPRLRLDEGLRREVAWHRGLCRAHASRRPEQDGTSESAATL
jgi:nucleoside-diphosphate-sugar epimerase